jgi:hypothetical protein
VLVIILSQTHISFAEDDFMILSEKARNTIEVFRDAYSKGDFNGLEKIIKFKNSSQKADIMQYCESNKGRMMWEKFSTSKYLILPKYLVDNEGNVHTLVLLHHVHYYEPLAIKMNVDMDKIVIVDGLWLFWDGYTDSRWPTEGSEVYSEAFEKRKKYVKSLDAKGLENYLKERIIDMVLLEEAISYLEDENKSLGGYSKTEINEYLDNTELISKGEHRKLELSRLDKIISEYKKQTYQTKRLQKEREDSGKQEKENKNNN